MRLGIKVTRAKVFETLTFETLQKNCREKNRKHHIEWWLPFGFLPFSLKIWDTVKEGGDMAALWSGDDISCLKLVQATFTPIWLLLGTSDFHRYFSPAFIFRQHVDAFWYVSALTASYLNLLPNVPKTVYLKCSWSNFDEQNRFLNRIHSLGRPFLLCINFKTGIFGFSDVGYVSIITIGCIW